MGGQFPSTSSRPDREASEATNRVSESVIDQHSHFDGLYITSRDLRIEGIAEGEIQCEGTVTIAEGARATATIRADTVILSGEAEGAIYCDERFVLQPSGRMNGRVAAAILVIEEGAFFEGQFRMVSGDEQAVFDEVDDVVGEAADEEEDSAAVAEDDASDLFRYSTADDDEESDESDELDDTLMGLEAEEEVV